MKNNKIKTGLLFSLLVFGLVLKAQFTDVQLGLKKGLVYSQIGYLPTDKKEVLFLGDTLSISTSNYSLMDELKQVVQSAKIKFVEKKWRRNIYLIDLSNIQTIGTYNLQLDNYIATIKIGTNIISGIGIPRIFQSFFIAQRKETDTILPLRRRVPGTTESFVLLNKSMRKKAGWKDACSDDQHIIHSGICADLMTAYEINPGLFDNDKENNVPRILAEVKWGLTYILSMQQPSGSFYCTVKNTKGWWDTNGFDRCVINDTSTYLNVRAASALAQGSTVLKKYFPGFADSCLNAAKKGWNWHLNNPNITYNEQTYWDAKYDSKLLGALELWKATGEQQYKDTLDAGILRGKMRYTADGQRWDNPGWGWQSGVGSDYLGWFGMPDLTANSTILLTYAKYYPLADNTIKTKIKSQVSLLKSWLTSNTQKSYKFFEPLLYEGFGMCGSAMSGSAKIMQLAKVLNDNELMNIAIENINFIFGKNPIGKSFVSRVGTNIHKNSWATWADTIKGAVLPGIILTKNLPTDNSSLSGDLGALGWRVDEWSTNNTSGMLVCFSIMDSRNSLTNPVVAVTGLTMNPKTATLNVGTTLQLTATIAPANSTNQMIIWSSSDISIAKVNTIGTVTSVSDGKATITATSVDGAKIATCEVTSALVSSVEMHLQNQEKLKRFSIFLNPANSTLQIKINELQINSENKNILIVNSSGQIVLSNNLSPLNFEYSLNINQLKTGFYLIKIGNDVQKIIIHH